MKSLILLVAIAHAGWWSDFCNRHLIADDPYQAEEISTENIQRYIANLEIKERWQKISPSEQRYLDILRAELARR